MTLPDETTYTVTLKRLREIDEEIRRAEMEHRIDLSKLSVLTRGIAQVIPDFDEEDE